MVEIDIPVFRVTRGAETTTMRMMTAREAIHALVDELPEERLPKIRRVLEEEVRDNGETEVEETELSAYEKAKAAGLVGCVEGPPDLSTNPAHMADFGK